MAKCGGLLLFLGLLSTVGQTVLASDPDLTTDLGINSTSAVDFTSTKLRNIASQPPKSALITPVAFNNGLPGLTGLGLQSVLFSFGPESQIDPHTHPRATEVFFLLEGIVDVGFVDTANTFFAITLKKGDLFVFPKGTLHFQRNNQKDIATGYSVLSSENPGVLQANMALFTSGGTGLPDNVLATAFGTSEDVVESIKKKLSA